MHLAASQRALLSCCPGCCWFGEVGVSPCLCSRSHPLSQPAHRTSASIPAPGLRLPLQQGYFYPAFYAWLSTSTLLLLWEPGKPAGSGCVTHRPGQSEGAMDVHAKRGGMEVTTLCRAPVLSRERGVRVTAKPKMGRCSSWQDKSQAAQSHPVL